MKQRPVTLLAWLTFVMAAATPAAAQETFRLRLESTGQEYGPFEYREGAEVRLGRAVFTVVPDRVEPAPAPSPAPAAPAEPVAAEDTAAPDVSRRGDVTGYDGIRFGDDVDAVLRALLWLPGVEKDDLGAPMFRKARGEKHHQYRVFRSPDENEDRSEVMVFFDDKGVDMIQDTFTGKWLWDVEQTRREFEKRKQHFVRRWGPPTEELDDYVEWIRPSGIAALRLDLPEKKGDLPVLKLGLRRKGQ